MTAPLTGAPNLLAPVAQASAGDLARRGEIDRTAREFEASFLSIMFQQMFAGVELEAPFGGGSGERMFQSFLTEALAKETVKAGGVGVADAVKREMLKLQGLE